jgi:hypothetical protein
MKVGNRIRIAPEHLDRETEEREFIVVEHRQTFGVFWSEEAREAGDLTPLCDLYIPAEDSETEYIPNYGEYDTKMVPCWTVVPEDEER